MSRTPSTEHLALLPGRKVKCDAPGCPEIASRFRRRERGRDLVARCATHDDRP